MNNQIHKSITLKTTTMINQRKAFLYPRVSTDEQADGYSLAHQEEVLIRYCEKENVQVVGIYREDHSAKTFDRPEFQKMLHVISKNKGIVDLILFSKWDRFSRNVAAAYEMIGKLKRLSVEPQSIEQPLDMDIPESKIMLAIYLTTPEVENDRRALNTLHGMRRAKKEGRYLGIAPIGYKNGRDAQNKPFLIPNEKAETVRWAFEELSRGIWDIDTLRRMANRKGLKIGRSQFWSLVRNPVYCGKVFIAAYKNEPAHCVKGIHEPIIPEGLFDDVQDVLKGKKRNVRVNTFTEIDQQLPLRGFLICPRCGRLLSGSGSKGNGGIYYYYHCQSVKFCKERFRADTANEAFVRQLCQIAVNAPIIDYYCQLISNSLKKDNQGKEQELKETQAEIDKLYTRIQNARSLRLDDEFTAEEFKEIKTDLTKKIEDLEKKKTKLISTNDNYQEYLSQGGEIIKNIANRYITASPIGKKQIIGSIFAEKLIFSENKFRTTEPNVILELISRPRAGSDDYKKQKVGDFSDLSAFVPRTGIEPAHHRGTAF
ncbi:recombinase family protein [Chitinophaga pinensis]